MRHKMLIGRGLHRGDRLNSCGRGARTAKILKLQHKVREEKREGDAHPNDSFGNGVTQFLQPGDAKDHADFEEDDSHGEAASHPLAVQLHFTLQDEVHGDGGGEHPDRGIGESGEAEGTRAAHALFVILDVEADWRREENAGDIEAADHAMKFCEALAKAIGELHWPEQERARAHDAVRQKLPLEGADMSPLGMFGVDQKAFVVAENISHH